MTTVWFCISISGAFSSGGNNNNKSGNGKKLMGRKIDEEIEWIFSVGLICLPLPLVSVDLDPVEAATAVFGRLQKHQFAKTPVPRLMP